MFVPTCATCHMSGINGLGITHDPSERLSYYLANAISEKRPNYSAAQAKMKQVCAQCHTPTIIDPVYERAEKTVQATNEKVTAAKAVVDGLRKDGVLPDRHSRIQLISCTSISGTTMVGRPNTAHSWAGLILCSGMETIRCCARQPN
jgi:hypothetical protein